MFLCVWVQKKLFPKSPEQLADEARRAREHREEQAFRRMFGAEEQERNIEDNYPGYRG